MFTLRDIGHDCRNLRALTCSDGTETHFYRKNRSVFAPRKEIPFEFAEGRIDCGNTPASSSAGQECTIQRNGVPTKTKRVWRRKSVTAEDILVKAEMRHEHEETKGKVHVCEFASGNLFRTIHLPKRIDPDKVTAEFKNGMLTLKAEIAEEVQTKKISVGAV
jgi:hypothetical protein